MKGWNLLVDIILCGKAEDHSLSEILVFSLLRYGGVRFSSRIRMCQLGSENPDFLVWDCEQIPEVALKKGILVFKNSYRPTPNILIPPEFLCVFESHNQYAAEVLKKVGASAAVCGLSARETLSISSLDYESAVLSLLRNVKTIQGNLLEPHDFEVKTNREISPRHMLVTAMVLLLLGMDSSNGFIVGK